MLFKSSLLLPLAVVSVVPVFARQKPNIVYVLADDLGYGDLSCYNAEGKITTKHLDQMAKCGVMFTDAHTSSSVSTPTRYGIITGRYNWRSTLKSGVLSGYSRSLIAEDRRTVADALSSKGYATAAIGKWHLGWQWEITAPDQKGLTLDQSSVLPTVDFTRDVEMSPNDHGFDYFYCFCGSLDMSPYVWVENNKVVEQPTKITSNKGMEFWRPGPTAEHFVHREILQDVADKAKVYIEQQAKSQRPFFLYLPLPAPHSPILPSDEFLGKSRTNTYGDYVMQVDDLVGQLREKLKEMGVADNTILIFTSDNGCSPKADFNALAQVGHSPNGALRGSKADLYEGGHRVPFIVEWPAGATQGFVCDDVICTTDLFATAADVAGYKLKSTEAEDSFSFLAALKGKNGAIKRRYTVHHSITGAFAIRRGEWKMLFAQGSEGWTYPMPSQIKKQGLDLPKYQLFNLSEDISETNNLYGCYPEIEAELLAAMQRIISEGRSTPGARQSNDGAEVWSQIEAIFQ